MFYSAVWCIPPGVYLRSAALRDGVVTEMLRGIAAATSSASAAPLPVREASAAVASANANSQGSTVTPVEQAAPQTSLAVAPPEFRFNSTEFVYRQDIGRIILIGQSPVTGERKLQIPSEEALRAYERTIKAEEQRSLLAVPTQVEPTLAPIPEHSAAPVPTPKASPAPSLAQALTAALGGGQGGALVSVSA